MNEKKTEEVEQILANLRPKQLDDFYKDNSKYMEDAPKAFYYYMKDVVEAKNVLFKDMYIKAGVSESYGEKIIRMERHTKNRDLIIRLCLAGRFSLVEINKALKLYKMNSLYAKDKRDACIIVAVNNRIYDLISIDEMLEKQGLPKLSV